MTTRLDVTTDNNRGIFLEPIKEALPENWQFDSETLQKMSDACFADRISRQHPIYDRNSSLLSAGYLAMNDVAGDHPVFLQVKAAAAIFGAEKEFDAIVAAAGAFLNSETKSASAAEEHPQFALEIEDGGQTSQHYPITSAMRVKDSAWKIEDDYVGWKLPTRAYRMACVAIKEAAVRFKVPPDELPRQVVLTGESRLQEMKGAEERILLRKMAMLKDVAEALSDSYVEIVKSARAGETTIDDAMDALDELDSMAGLDRSRNTLFINPHLIFHNGPTEDQIEKMASQVIMFNEVMVPVNELASMNRDKLQGLFPLSVAATIKGASEAAESGDFMKAVTAITQLDSAHQNRLLGLLAESWAA